MKLIDLKSWEAFEAEVAELTRQREQLKNGTGNYISEYLFRGQSDSAWHLETTLERYVDQLPTLEKYYRVLCKMKPQVEAFTGISWEKMPSLTEYIKEIGDEGLLPPGKFPAYECFVYLRHHGFPSPLLDWTRSPYVAAYFAFRNVTSKAQFVSIYAYCEYPVGRKSVSSNEPNITGLGPYVRGHRRHFQQQAQYTICTAHKDDKHTYATHEAAFAVEKKNQDELWKFNIPASEREKVLKRLEQYNINAFSLFGSEESLMEALAFRELLYGGSR